MVAATSFGATYTPPLATVLTAATSLERGAREPVAVGGAHLVEAVPLVGGPQRPAALAGEVEDRRCAEPEVLQVVAQHTVADRLGLMIVPMFDESTRMSRIVIA